MKKTQRIASTKEEKEEEEEEKEEDEKEENLFKTVYQNYNEATVVQKQP